MARKRKTDEELFKEAVAEPNETVDDTLEETEEECNPQDYLPFRFP